MLNRKIFASSLFILLPWALSAQWWESSLSLEAGYRQDSLTCLIEGYDLPDTLLFKNNLNVENISVVEIGAKGRCIAWDSFLFKSSLYSGITPTGNYSDVRTFDFSDEKRSSKFKVQSGITVDFSVGTGFLFPFYCRKFRIGPTGGWSYNAQQLTIYNGCRKFDGLKYRNRWQGPWVGIDSYIALLGFHLDAGYEYHFPHWSAYRLLKRHHSYNNAYSDSRKSTRGYGNVAYFDFYTTQFLCIKLNCQLKYQYWKMTDGCERPKRGHLPYDEVHQIPHATWQSFEVLFGIGIDV